MVTLSQDKNGFVMLDTDKLELKRGSNQSWKFNIEYPGDYTVQIFFNGEAPKDFNVKIRSGNDSYITEIRKDLMLNDANITNGSHYERFSFSPPGEYEIEIIIMKTPVNDPGFKIEALRIIPDEGNRWASVENHKKWLKMSGSASKKQALKEFNDMKFGMFIHWGLFSLLGGMWKGKKASDYKSKVPELSEWIMRKAEIPRSEYRRLAAKFNPHPNTAESFVKLAKITGMKYICLTSKHHEGFSLFGSQTNEFNIVDATPYARDFIDELYAACCRHDIKLGLNNSAAVDWMDGGDNGYYSGKEKRDRLGIASGLPQENIYDPSPNTYEEYLRRKALPQIKEIMRKYPDIKFIWFDVDKNLPENVAFEFYKTCYDINPKVLMNRRIGYSFADYVDAGDNGIPKSVNEMVKPWETIGTTNNSWGYASYDQDWKSPAEILYWLVEVASKGGNYMLNIGPEGDGSVPSKCVKNMQIVGKWMHINGEAIYGTKSWISTFEGTYQGVMEGTEDRKLKGFNANFGEGDFWFTQKDDAVYAIAMKYPSGKGVVNAFAQGKVKIKEAFVLGACASFHWEQSEKGLEFILNEKPNELGYTIKVIIQ